MIETGAAGRHALHPIEVVGSASSQEDRRREVSRSVPTSGRQNTTNVRLVPTCTRARQGLATTKAKIEARNHQGRGAERREVRRTSRRGTRYSEKKQKLRRAGEERPLGELELDRVGKAKIGSDPENRASPKGSSICGISETLTQTTMEKWKASDGLLRSVNFIGAMLLQNWVTSLLGTRARSLASDACRLVSKSNECGHTAQPCAQARTGA